MLNLDHSYTWSDMQDSSERDHTIVVRWFAPSANVAAQSLGRPQSRSVHKEGRSRVAAICVVFGRERRVARRMRPGDLIEMPFPAVRLQRRGGVRSEELPSTTGAPGSTRGEARFSRRVDTCTQDWALRPVAGGESQLNAG